MADYQSSFSGEEIDDILAKAKSGGLTVQSDYAQNDSTQSDYIKNRPFYKGEGFKYEWDGNTDGLEVVGVVEGLNFYKVSSDVISQDELIGASIKSYFDGDDIEGEITQDGNISVAQTSAGNLIVLYGGHLPLLCVFAQTGEDTFATATFIVETTGLWFLRFTGEEEYTRYLQKDFSIKTLDEEYLPDTVITEADKGVPNGVATLDSDGKIPVEQLPDGIGNEGEKEVEFITGNLDLATLTMSNLSHTYQQILEAIDGNKNIILRGETILGPAFATLSYVDISRSLVAFNLLTYVNIGAGLMLYCFRITVNANNNVDVAPLTISTVS